MKGRKRSWMAIASSVIVVAAAVLAVLRFCVSTDSNIERERRMERKYTAANGGLFEKIDTAPEKPEQCTATSPIDLKLPCLVARGFRVLSYGIDEKHNASEE